MNAVRKPWLFKSYLRLEDFKQKSFKVGLGSVLVMQRQRLKFVLPQTEFFPSQLSHEFMKDLFLTLSHILILSLSLSRYLSFSLPRSLAL